MLHRGCPMPNNKDHWYDGFIYDAFIASYQDTAFSRIKDMVKNEASVLDVGCATGRLAFQLADKCRHIDGVDLSRRNIRVAARKLEDHPTENISFHHDDVLQFLLKTPRRYDVAVLTYVIHEIDEPERHEILDALSKAASEIVIVDYLSPQPRNLTSFVNELVEYVAGPDHYRNFRSFIRADGLRGLARRAGLSIVREEQNKPPTSHMMVLAGTRVGICDVCW